MKRLFVVASAVAALWVAACGGGGSTVTPPPPSGKYALASLTGTYSFMTNGEVFASGNTSVVPLARVGSFTADGMGHITGGLEDVNASGTVTSAIPINSTSSYTVNADGRGTLTLNLTANGIPNTINFAIILTSTSAGLLIDETSNSTQASTGSGNFVLQTGSLFKVGTIAGTYVFDFSGQNFSQGISAPLSLVGEFTAGNGVISTGFEDVNDNFALSNGSISGSLTPDATNIGSFGRGTALIGGETYAFYIVDSTRVRFIDVSTSGNMLSGDAVLQTSVPTSLTTGFAFLVAGTTGSGGVTRVGRFSASGTSVSNVEMDTNNASAFHLTGGNSGSSVSSASMSLDPANPGRGTLTFTDSSLSVPLSFVFYLSSSSSGVIQETSQSPSNGVVDVADGSIAAQSGNPFSSANLSGTYALNWSGLSVQKGGSFAIQDEEDLLAQATVSSLALSGTADIFQFTNGVPNTNLGLGGTISVGGDGTGGDGQRNSMIVNLNGASPINFVVYVASPQVAFFANNNNSGTQRVVAGLLKSQQ